MSLEREASLLLRGEDKGVGKMLAAVTKSSINLNKEIVSTASSFQDVGDSVPTKSLKLFNKTSKNTISSAGKLGRSMRGVSTNYSGLIDKTEKANTVLEASDNMFIKLGANALGAGKNLDVISSGLEPAAGFWQQYSRASSGAGKALVLAKTAGKSLNPVLGKTSSLALEGAKTFREMGGAASILVNPLESVAKNLNKTQKGLKVAGFASDVNQMLESVKEFKEDTLPELQEQLEDTLETLDKLGLKEKFFGSSFKTLNTTATVLSATTKGLTKNLSDTFLGFVKFKEVQGYVSVLSNAASELNRTFDDTYRSVEEFQSLGIDTTFQEAALSIGIMGEKLLTSGEAAKKFRQQAVSAFAGFQDQLAYLTTLSGAAAQGQDRLGSSILNLVNGPLKNSVSAMEAATGYYDALSAGQSSVEFLNASLKFSAATGASATDSIGALAQVHNIYKLNARDAAKTAALFNATIENGVINGAEMASGIGQLASVAKSAGIDMEELNAMLAALTKNGFSATDAFQGLMSLITSIAGQGSESAKAAQELGVRFDFARIKAEGLMEPINDLYSAAKGSDARIKTIVPDALAYRTAIALATNASSDFVDVQNKMSNLDTKSLDIVFERRRDSILQRSSELREGFNNEMIRFGQDLQATMTPAIAAGERTLETFKALPEPIRNFIIAASKANIPLEKAQQATGILSSSLGNIVKTLVVARLGFLAFGAAVGGKGKQQLLTIIDLVKNQKNYIGALQTFVGLSDSVAAKIKNLTSAEKAQFITNQKLLAQRKTAIASLQKMEAANNGGQNLFKVSDRDFKKDINRSFKNATPLVKEKVQKLRADLTEQFQDFRVSGGRSNILLNQLGLNNLKDTEAELSNALTKINRASAQGLRGLNLPRGEKAEYLERLKVVEDNIKKRQELLKLSRTQLDLERQGVANLESQIEAINNSVKSNLNTSKAVLQRSINDRDRAIEVVKRNSRGQFRELTASIEQQMQNLSPRFASVLANKTGAELDGALSTIRRNLAVGEDAQIDKLIETVEQKKALTTATKSQIQTMQFESKALQKAIAGKKLDLAERQKVMAAIAQETALREASIVSVQKNRNLDFFSFLGNDDIEKQIQSRFKSASTEVQKQSKKLAKGLKATSTGILGSNKAMSLMDTIGLSDAKTTAKDLDLVALKLNEVKQAGTVDARTLRLLERNLESRRQLAALTDAETVSLRSQNTALAAHGAALNATNLQRAQQIGFIGPLAALNVKLTASIFAATAALQAETIATGKNILATKLNVVWTKTMAAGKIAAAGASSTLTLALSKLWLMLGPIGAGILALIAGFVALGKIRSHIKTMNESILSLDKLTTASENFTKQVELAREIRNFASDLREYSSELKQSAENAELAGEDVGKLKQKIEDFNNLDLKQIRKTGKEFDTISKVTLDSFIDELNKAADSLLEYNSAGTEAFDQVTINNITEQSIAIASAFRKQAEDARELGNSLEAIKYDDLAKRTEDAAQNIGDIDTKFEEMLRKQDKKNGTKELDAYKERQKKLFKEREKFDRKAISGRGSYNSANADDQKEKDYFTKIATGIRQARQKAQLEVDEIQKQTRRLSDGELFSQVVMPGSSFANDSKQILDTAKENVNSAGLTAQAMKDLIAVEQKAVKESSLLSDRRIQNLQSDLDVQKKNKKITTEEIADREAVITKLKEENTAREEAAKLRLKQLKNAQSAAEAIDINNAGNSTAKLLDSFNQARIKIITETADDATAATKEFKEEMKKLEADASKVGQLPAKYRTASLDYFDEVAKGMQKNMNTNTAYQRRQLAIANYGLAELATNVELVEQKGTEGAQAAADKAVENARILQQSGALSPKAIALMLGQIKNLTSEIDIFGVKGSVLRADQIEEINNLLLESQQEASNRLVKINQQAIEGITHLQSMALITEEEARKQTLELEVKNNELLLKIQRDRYAKISELRGKDTKEGLDAYADLLQAQRALEVSQFQQKLAIEAQKQKVATDSLNLATGKTVFNYNEQLDELQLISHELERQKSLIDVYNQTIVTALNFLDGIASKLTSRMSDERSIASLQEHVMKRNLKMLKLQQYQEIQNQKRQVEQNKLKQKEALINNEIAYVEKEREITLARMAHEEEKRNRKLNQREKEAFALKMEQMERERSQIDIGLEKLRSTFDAENKIAESNLRSLELKQEQARSGGVLDVIEAKLSKLTARYKEQEKIVAANSNSYNAGVNYANQLLGLVGQVTTDEQQQQRLAQITAQTKLVTLKKQQDFEQRTLDIQQQQNIALLKQEKIKLDILATEQKTAIVEDRSDLLKARQEGDSETANALSAVLESRVEILGTIDASSQSLDREISTQKKLNRIERNNLNLKQQAETREAQVGLNATRPEGKKKEREAKRLQRQMLKELGLNSSSLNQTTFNSPSAKLPKNISLALPKELDLGQTISNATNEFLNKIGVNSLLTSDTETGGVIDKNFKSSAKENLSKRPSRNILDYADPEAKNDIAKFFRLSPQEDLSSSSGAIPSNINLSDRNNLDSPSVEQKGTEAAQKEATSLSLYDIAKSQLEAQKLLVEELRKQNKLQKQGDMYNEIDINVENADRGVEELESLLLNKLDNIVTQAKNME